MFDKKKKTKRFRSIELSLLKPKYFGSAKRDTSKYFLERKELFSRLEKVTF